MEAAAVPAVSALVWWLSSLSSRSVALLSEAVVVAATLPLKCKLALSQTFHICAGWLPPFSFAPGCGPLPICWVWLCVGLLLGVVVGVVFYHLVVVHKLLKAHRDTHAQRVQADAQVQAQAEFLQLLVAGGQEVLQQLAQERGVSELQFLQQCLQVQVPRGRCGRGGGGR